MNDAGLSLAAGTTFDMSAVRGAADTATALGIGPLNGSGRVVLGDNSLYVSLLGDTTFDGQIIGAGGLEVSSGRSISGRFTLTSPQSYTGGTRVLGRSDDFFSGGATLALSGSASLAPSGVLSVGANGGVFDISAASGDREVGSLDGEGLIELGDHTLIFGSETTARMFSGVIQGSGGLTKRGSGTQILRGVGTYSGVTRVNDGILAAVPGALGPTIVNNAELEFQFTQADQPALPIAAYSGDISGSGRVSKTGDGVVWLRGTNRYTGGTEVRNGALIGNGRSLQGDVRIDEAIAAFYQVEDGTYAGHTSGSGLLLKYGPGRLRLTGENMHTGGTAFSGPVRIAADEALGARGGSLGIIDGTLEIEDDLTIDRPLFLAGDAALDTRGFDLDLGSDTSGPGSLSKLGAGRLIMRGDHAYTGLTRVAAGEIHLLGALTGAVSVEAGARLSGTGEIHGDLVLGAGSAYGVTVDAAGSAERLTVGGSARLQGATLEIDAVDGAYRASTRYTVLSAGNGIHGRFDAVTTNLAFLDPALSYDETAVELTLARNDRDYADLATTPDQASTGAALTAMGGNASGDAAVVIEALTTLSGPEVGPALDAIGGLGLTAIPHAAQVQSRALGQQISSRLHALENTASFDAFAYEVQRGVLLAMNDSDSARALPVYAAALGAATAQAARNDVDSGLWLRGLGGAGSIEITANADVGLSTVGVIGGFDHRLTGAVILGLFAGYTDSELDQDTPVSDTEVASWKVGGYGRWQPGTVHVDAVFSYGGDRFETMRRLVIGPLARTARGDFDGDTYNAYLEAGYTHRWDDDPMPSLQPYFALQWARQSQDPYVETGAGALNLVVPEDTTDSVRSVTGVRLHYARESARAGAISAEVRGAWAHEFEDQGAFRAGLAGDPTGTLFQASGSSQPRDSALVGAGVALQNNRHWRGFADFDAELNSRQQTFGVSAGLRYSW